MTVTIQIQIDGATLRSLNGKAPSEETDPPEADLVFRAEVVDDMRQLLSRVGKAFKLGLLGADVAEGQKPTTFELGGATLRGLSGKAGSEATSVPLADLTVRVDVTPDIQTLLALVGKTFHLTFTPEVEQLGMFVEDGKSDETGGDEPDVYDAEPLASAEHDPGVPLTNGNASRHAADDFSVSDPPPPKLDEITTRRVRRRASAAVSGDDQ